MVRIGKHEIELSNEDKLLFPGEGISKGEVVEYYRKIAEVMLPHLRDRPVSLQRFPDGIGEEGFFQKNMPDYFPGWFRSVNLSKEGGSVAYPVVDDAASLVYLANQGTITLHAALAKTGSPHHPDRLVFDLDPSGDDFGAVQGAARRVRKALEELDLPVFVQTTGSRGLHVVVPLDRSADFDAVRDFARRAADTLAERHPDALTAEQRKDKRQGRLYLDAMRNAYGQTAVMPYSLRAKPGAPVATPLAWDELGAGDLTAQRYHIGNLFRRLGQVEDPWADMKRHAAGIAAADEALSTL